MRSVSIRDIAVVVDNLLSEGVDTGRVAHGLAAYLIEERRSAEVDAVLRNVEQLRQERGTYDFRVTTAFSLPVSTVELLRGVVARTVKNAKQIIFSMQRDPRAIGGARIESNELLWEHTIAARLQQLSRSVNVNT